MQRGLFSFSFRTFPLVVDIIILTSKEQRYIFLLGIFALTHLTLKAPITTAADDTHKYFFQCFSEKIRQSDVIFQVNPLLARQIKER